MKIPVTPSGIEPATFWLEVQCLNQLRQRMSPLLLLLLLLLVVVVLVVVVVVLRLILP